MSIQRWSIGRYIVIAFLALAAFLGVNAANLIPSFGAIASADTAVMPVDATPDYAHSHNPRPGAVDFAEGCGADVHAPKTGTVTEVYGGGGHNGGWGNDVVIQYNDGTSSRQAHLSDINVAVGQPVNAGDVIGWVGNTGDSSACHLHVETYGATAVDFFSGAGTTPAPAAEPQQEPVQAAVQVSQPVTTQVTQTDPVWDRLAGCESTHTWDINTGNGYYGGLQFSPTTWTEFGGGEFASSAHQATREQQILIAERVQAVQGWRAWPSCTAELGISADPIPSTTVEVPGVAPVPADPAPATPADPIPATQLPANVEQPVVDAVDTLPVPVQDLIEPFIPQPAAPAATVQPQSDPAPVQPVIPQQVYEAAPAPVQDFVEQVAPQFVPQAEVPQADPIPAPMAVDPVAELNAAVNAAVADATANFNNFVAQFAPGGLPHP